MWYRRREQDITLRAKLTSTSLEVISTKGLTQGVNADLVLCSNPDGRALLAQDDLLRAKLTPASLDSEVNTLGLKACDLAHSIRKVLRPAVSSSIESSEGVLEQYEGYSQK
ncbi:MAG: hypothetical protein QM652_07780 [Legionella sp.]|uniref:hypothetical protein n=1 Tax=Legionella sp. TaxID=459 RepID=UPI0039E4A26D